MSVNREQKLCCVRGCNSVVLCVGRCGLCYWTLRREHPEEHKRLMSLTPAEREIEYAQMSKTVIPHYEYENPEGEAELAAAAEQQARASTISNLTNDELETELLRRLAMSKEFIAPTTDATRKIVDNTLTGDYEAFDRMKRALAGHLNIAIDRGAETMSLPPTLGGRTSQQEASLPEQSARPQNCIRVVYPSGNTRVEIYGATEEDLDRQEAAIRSIYGNQQ